jgi:hypothetical protein
MATEEKIEKIEKVSRGADAVESVDIDTAQPNKEQFNALLQQDVKSAPQQLTPENTGKVSLMETVSNTHQTNTRQGQATYENLVTQTKQALEKIESIKKTLETPDITIKASVRNLLQNKLSHIDDGLKIALTKVDAEYNVNDAKIQAEAKEVSGTERVNPIERFLGFVTDGQYQLAHLGEQLQVMGVTGKELSPTNMLAVQVKMGWIQQELELFSNLLNKSLESIKTIMNIQV